MIASATGCSDIRWGDGRIRSLVLHGRRLWHFVVKLLGGRVQWIGSDKEVGRGIGACAALGRWAHCLQ